MKKVLFATTALVLSAGVAAADVALTGDARMGIVNDGTLSTFNSRARVSFNMSGETENGLSFGASFRGDQLAGDNNAGNGRAGSVFISGDFGRLSMGDSNNAHQLATGQVAGVGYVGVGDRNEVTYLAKVNTTLAYRYTIDGLTVHVTSGQQQAAGTPNTTAAGVSYKFGDITVAAGMAEQGTKRQTSASVRGSFEGVSAALVYVDNNTAFSTAIASQTALSLGYKIDDISLTAFTRQTNNRTLANVTASGFGASYSLGGGATLAAGYSTDSTTGAKNLWDLGMTFSF
jgi:outer membrane protein OmpU